jgi:IclR family transcriptional regulator, acetate operon repressor
MSVSLDRGLSIIEILSRKPEGMALSLIASELAIPLSTCHQLLGGLQRRGYVRQQRKQGDYVLTTRVASLGLMLLGSYGVVELAGPKLHRLAQFSGEVVRLSIVDEERLVWVAKSHGTREWGSLRYEPMTGTEVRLSCTATGQAWLMTLDDELALRLVARQGFGSRSDYGPKAPATIKALLDLLKAARGRGYAVGDEVHAPGMAAMAAPVYRRNQAVAVVSISAPCSRMPSARMNELAPALLETAADLTTA